jgi:ATP-dependent Clp protease ATP-binding subunit ClpX
LRAIVKKAIQLKTGARGLRSILETIFLDTMYDLPSETVKEIIFTEESIVYGAAPIKVYEKNQSKTQKN